MNESVLLSGITVLFHVSDQLSVGMPRPSGAGGTARPVAGPMLFTMHCATDV
jgi:hypothetical protein